MYSDLGIEKEPEIKYLWGKIGWLLDFQPFQHLW